MTSDTSQLGLAVGQTSETRQKPGLKHIVQQKHLREKCTHPNKRPKFRGAGFHGLDYELRAERAKTVDVTASSNLRKAFSTPCPNKPKIFSAKHFDDNRWVFCAIAITITPAVADPLPGSIRFELNSQKRGAGGPISAPLRQLWISSGSILPAKTSGRAAEPP